MSRSRRFPRWTAAALLAAAVAVGAAGCVAVTVGGYAEPAVVLPAPGVVIAPPPVIFGHRHYGGRSYRGYGYYGRGGNRWRG
jgi:hypothetical protein